MTQQELEIALAEIPVEKMALLTKEELIALLREEQSLRKQFQKDNERLRALNEELKQKSLLIEEHLVTIKNKLFGTSSERSAKSTASGTSKPKSPRTRVQLPSERYPNTPLIERHVEFEQLPSCSCCGLQMSDSGMTEDAEFLTVVPEQYIVVRQMRHKYRCETCHGDIKTAPAPPRIMPGSSYSDEMMIDVSLAKFCDLIPVERYAAIAARAGMKGLPQQSLIECTHYVADYVKVAYRRLKNEILLSTILHADETPHRMLEGSKGKSWYLWGFSTPETSFFEIHDTRSGDVASEILLKSKCEFLVSDVFSGYGRAVRESNKVRKERNLTEIRNVYCNAHARRKFKEALNKSSDEASFYLKQYRFIYRLEKFSKDKPPELVTEIRKRLLKYFERMKTKAMSDIGGYSSKSSFGKAMSYFLGNYEALTLFCGNTSLPIDNNPQERLLRSPVIGRKTWYGTHSERGAETTAILFSLVESCKLNGINPREYIKKLVQDLHQGLPAFTPREYRNLPPDAG